MRAVITSALIALAIIATLALLPASSWIFKNQMDLVFRGSGARDLGSYGEIGSILPNWLNDPNTYLGDNPAEELTHALDLSSDLRATALKSYNEKHPNDVLGWAVTVRMSCMYGNHPPDAPKSKDQSWMPKHRSILDMGINACQKGEILEPNNAYFPLMRAEFLMERNRLDEMRSAISLAASKTRYDSHVSDEAQTMERAQIHAKGYRGELVRTGIDASVLLPDFAHIKGLARYINRKEDLNVKRDFINVMHVMGMGEHTAIGFLVAAASLNLMLCNLEPYSSNGPKISGAERKALAAEFDSKLKAAGIAPPSKGTLTTFTMLQNLVDATHRYIDTLPTVFSWSGDDSRAALYMFVVTVGPYCMLFGLMISFMIAVIPWFFSRLDSAKLLDMSPQIVGMPVWMVSALLMNTCCDNSSSMSGLVIALTYLTLGFLKLQKRAAMTSNLVLGVGALATILATNLADNITWVTFCIYALASGFVPLFVDEEVRKKIAVIGSFCLLAWAFLARDVSAVAVGLFFLVSYGLNRRNKEGELPKAANVLTIILYVLVCGVMGILVTLNGATNSAASTGFLNVWEQILRSTGMRNGQVSANILASLIMGIVLGVFFLGRGPKIAQKAICVSWLIFSGMYLLMSGLQLRENHRLSKSETNLVNESNNIRKLAGQSTQ